MRNALKLLLLLCLVLFLVPLVPLGYLPQAVSSPAKPGADADTETIVIRADRAWEEADGSQVLHFAGNFELISPDGQLRSDEADFFGPLDDPTRIIARGVPAAHALNGLYAVPHDSGRSLTGRDPSCRPGSRPRG